MFIEPFSQTLLTYQKTNLFPLALPDSTLLTFRKRSPTVPLKALSERSRSSTGRRFWPLALALVCSDCGVARTWKGFRVEANLKYQNSMISFTCHILNKYFKSHLPPKKMLSFRCQVTACMESHKNMHSNAWKRHWCLCFPLM